MAVTLKYRFAMRRRTAADWTSLNEVLIQSEWGHETDTNLLKIGDGVTPWNGLDYYGLIPSGVTPGTYGDADHAVQFTVNEFGQVTEAVDVPIAGGGGKLFRGGFSDPTTEDGDFIIRKSRMVTDLAVLFIGDSITSGQLVTTAPVGPAATSLSQGVVTVTGVNEGVPASKVSDWLPGTANYVAAVSAGDGAGSRLAHIMLGANDAIASVSPATYRANLLLLCGGLIADGYTVVVSYPTYSPDHVATLQSYSAAIDSLVDNYHVFLGDTRSMVYFLDNPGELQSDRLHPTQSGSDALAGFWAVALQALVNGMTDTTALQRATLGGELRANYDGDVPVLTTTEVLRIPFAGASAGQQRRLALPKGVTVESWEILANTSGSMVLDIYAGSYASYPPAVSICGSNKPSLLSSSKGRSSTLTGWTPAIPNDSALIVNIDSISAITEFELALNCVHYVASAPTVSTYFDAANTATEMVLTNSTRNAQRSSSNQPNWRSAFSAVSHSSGQYYVEFEVVALEAGGSGGSLVGLGDSGASLNSFVGSTSNGYGIQNNTGGSNANLWNNSSLTSSSIARWGTVGAWARVAVDLDAGKIWLGVAGGWAGGGDPATGTSPTYTFTPGLTLFAVASCESAPAEIKMNAKTAEFKSTIPSGFSPWIT